MLWKVTKYSESWEYWTITVKNAGKEWCNKFLNKVGTPAQHFKKYLKNYISKLKQCPKLAYKANARAKKL